MDVASVRAWLRGDVGHTVATDDVSAQEVTWCEFQNDLRPASNIEGSVGDLEGEIPDHTSVGLLAFVSMLRDAALVTLYSNIRLDSCFFVSEILTYWVLLPIWASNHIKRTADSVFVFEGAWLYVASHHQVEGRIVWGIWVFDWHTVAADSGDRCWILPPLELLLLEGLLPQSHFFFISVELVIACCMPEEWVGRLVPADAVDVTSIRAEVEITSLVFISFYHWKCLISIKRISISNWLLF